jgi:RNA polymerase sigma-70 factor (ECF subfamily)
LLGEAVNATASVKPVSEPATVGLELLDAQTLLERAYESQFPRVYSYVRYRVGSGDIADDLTSRTFLKALDRLSTFDPTKAELGAWILGIARNVVRDHLRARRRWSWLPLEWLREPSAPEPTPEEKAIRGEQRQRLLVALRGLSDRERVYRAVGKLRARLGGEEVRRA